MANQADEGTLPEIGSIIKTATQAVQEDGQGNIEQAILHYNSAASQLEKLIEASEGGEGNGSASDVEDWKAKVQQYKTRVTFLQQRLQEAKLEQYAQTAKLAQEGMSIAAKGQQAVKVAGGPSPLAGAAAVGAGVGLVLAGPIGAIAGAAGIAYAATTKETGVGEAARKTGQVAVDGYSAVRKFDSEYNISSKAYEATIAGVNKITELNKNYQVTDRVSNMAKTTTESLTKFEQKNQVISKLGSGLASALDWTTTRLGGNTPEKRSASETQRFPDVPSSSTST